MSIPTQMSLAGFIVSISDLRTTGSGSPQVRARVGVEQWRHDPDDTFIPLEPTYHDVVAYDHAASVLSTRFRPGDFFIASGYIHEYEITQRDGGSIVKEEFVARKIGHNANQTTYFVRRRPQPAPVPARAGRHQATINL